jgi:hypothetical protein
MTAWTHYVDPDDHVVCGCTDDHPSWTFASGRVTCPDCRRVLEARRGVKWMGEVTTDLERNAGQTRRK